MKKFIMFYYTDEEKYADLTDEELGRLLRAGMKYGSKGIEPNFSDNRFLRFAWTDLKVSIDINNASYEKQVQAGVKGGVNKNLKDKLNINDTQIKNLRELASRKGINFDEKAKEVLTETRESGVVYNGSEGYTLMVDRLS